jgi:hypothetical protein
MEAVNSGSSGFCASFRTRRKALVQPPEQGAYSALFMNFLKYELTYLNITANLITLKSRVFFAQAGKPVPPSSLLSGELSGINRFSWMEFNYRAA